MTIAHELATSCLRVILRGAARLALRYSMKLTDLTELMKVVLVDAAEEELARSENAVSGSRVSAMTGVHRKDVSRILKERGSFTPPNNLYSKIMAQWQTDPRFTTKAGKPRVLQAEGRHSEFARLVETVNGGNLSAYSVLFEMERMGIVSRKGNRVSLSWRDYVVNDQEEVVLPMLAEDTRDLMQSIEENLDDANQTPNLHLKTEFNKIPTTDLPEIRSWLLEEGSRFQQKVRNYLAQHDADINSSKKPAQQYARVALGTFSITEKLPDEAL